MPKTHTNTDITKSWFAVLNNPSDHNYPGSPQEVCEKLRDDWIGDSTTRAGIWAYCISDAGLHHVHMVLEDTVAMRFTAVKRTYAVGVHLEPTKGTKKQAEDYIYKRHPFQEAGEEVVVVIRTGTINGAPPKLGTMDTIARLIEEGQTPRQIMLLDFKYRRFEREIKSAFFDKRLAETPIIRDVKVHFLFGESGSGKTHTLVELCNTHGEDEVCIISDHATTGAFDHYQGEKVIFIDEYKGDFSYRTFLQITDQYKTMVHARFTNVWALWHEVYITSIYPLEDLFDLMVPYERRNVDTIAQMHRRITDITYCYRDENEAYCKKTIPGEEYLGADVLKLSL